MSSMTPARVTSTGLPRRVFAIVVAVAGMYAAAPPAAGAWHTAAVLATVAALAVATCSEEHWRRLVLVVVPGLARPGRGRHRAAAPAVLPLQRRATTSTVQTAEQGSTR